jgi:SNF2 family DNA or RNA helicase
MILIKLTPLPGGMVEAQPHGYDEAVRAQFKGVPGSRWDPERRAYIAPAEAIEGVLATLERAKVVKVNRSLVSSVPSNGTPKGLLLPGVLRPYQVDGIAFLRSTLATYGSAVLADEMGLGKTAQAILARPPGNTIVVCPAVVAGHWADEIAKWAGEPSLIWTGKRKPKVTLSEAFKTAPWLVLSYDMFRRLQPELPVAATVILDELHYLGDYKAQRSRAVRAYLARCEHRPALVGLTGTPITSWLQNLHNPLDLLFPARFGSWFSFTQRFCGGRYEELTAKTGRPVLDAEGLPRRVWRADGVSNLDELRTRLAPLLLRRTKADSGIVLPSRIRSTIPVELPASAQRELRALMSQLRTPDEMRRALVGVEAYKLDAAVELATDLRASGSKVLLFTTRRAHAHTLGERLGAPVVTGEDDPSARKARLVASDVGVATLFSVTTGIDLTHFDCAIFVGLDWVPSNLLQAEARLHRPNQTKTVNIYYLIGKPSIDEQIRHVVVDRLETFQAVLGTSDATGEVSLAQDLEDRSNLLEQIAQLVEAT